MSRPKILFVAPECAPFAKMGGLGDVVGALPRALAESGHDVRVVMPRYAHLDPSSFERHEKPVAVPLGDSEAWCAVYEGRLPNSDVPLYLLDHVTLFARGYIYDPPGGRDNENLVRFGLLNRGAFSLCRHLDWTPDVFHCHDWPTALVPIYANTTEREEFGGCASVLTLHNLAHQGFYSMAHYGATQLPVSELRADGLEHFGLVNMLKGGLYHATKITAVSPTYAEEIRTPDGGHGLDHVLRFRAGDVIGILNGIEEDVWNPATDPLIAARYDATKMAGKAVCKASLQREMGLEVTPDRPLCGVVSRLHYQKGLDLLAEAIPGIVEWGAQVVVLGSGEADLEAAFRYHSDHGGDQMRAHIGYDEALAHRIEAGCDFFFMPSRFEPCGLNQMYSQRYGTLPIVRSVGGLVDSVDDHDGQGGGTGFRFDELSAAALLGCTRRALDVWWQRPFDIHLMRERSMAKEMGWDVAGAQYAEVYAWAVENRRGAPWPVLSARAEALSAEPAPTPEPQSSIPPPPAAKAWNATKPGLPKPALAVRTPASLIPRSEAPSRVPAPPAAAVPTRAERDGQDD